jgi:RND family efflux transporter MFP subunit
MGSRGAGLRLATVAAVLGGGWVLMQALAGLKEPPTVRPTEERIVQARGIVARPETAQTELQGYATARAWRRARIGAEVGGRVAAVNAAVESGRRVQSGQWLVRIDPRQYQATIEQVEADLAALDQRKAQLEQQRVNDTRRLELLGRMLELAKADYERVRKLVEIDKVESRSKLDQAEAAWRAREHDVVQLENALALSPIQVRQAEADRLGALARLHKARLDLEKTEIAAPFTGRVDERNVELGEFVAPGTALLSLVDDSRLELAVPLEGAEVARWMAIPPAGDTSHWFGPLGAVPVEVAWAEQPEACRRTGRLDRVERYDSQSRTAVIVVVVEDGATTDSEATARFPLVEGMFCSVAVPGRQARDVYRVPRVALSQDGTLLVAVDGRMVTRPVTVGRYEAEWALIVDGLRPGETVLTTRPGRAPDGTRVEVTIEEAVGEPSAATSSMNHVGRPAPDDTPPPPGKTFE